MRDLIKNKEYFSNILESNDKKIIKYKIYRGIDIDM